MLPLAAEYDNYYTALAFGKAEMFFSCEASIAWVIRSKIALPVRFFTYVKRAKLERQGKNTENGHVKN